MINTLAQKIVTGYDNLPPQRKALADMFGVLLGVLIGSGIIAIAIQFNLFLEVALLMLAYGIGGMIVLIYKSRVEYYKFQEKYGKK